MLTGLSILSTALRGLPNLCPSFQVFVFAIAMPNSFHCGTHYSLLIWTSMNRVIIAVQSAVISHGHCSPNPANALILFLYIQGR